MSIIKQEREEIRGIIKKIKTRDFRGNSGQAIKGSTYRIATLLVAKIGSLIFTLILARMLLPELFGLYSLTLSTIVLFSVFSDLGVNTAAITFIAKSLRKGNPKKTRGYVNKLFKWKISLLIGSSLILMFSSYLVANFYYNKPIFYALLAGGLYIPIVGVLDLLDKIFQATNNFKFSLLKELLFQVARITLIPFLIILLIKKISGPQIITVIILTLVFCYFIALIFLCILARIKLKFMKVPSQNLTIKEDKSLKKFLIPLVATAFSGTFFGYIDTFMLGHYVSESFIAYYGVAFALIGSAGAILGFSSIVMIPIFIKNKKSIETMFRRTRNLITLLSIIAGVLIFLLSPYVIRIIYGPEYLAATALLKVLSVMVIITTITGIYSSYFVAKEETKIFPYLLIMATILNIILNLVGINVGLKIQGEYYAIIGACIASVLSRFSYLGGFIIIRKIKNKGKFNTR